MLCRGCGQDREDVEPRYSFGFFAGTLCEDCARRYKDRCGLDAEQGDPTELDEYLVGGPDAIWGEE